VTLINVSPSVTRSLIVQGGAYGEHQILSVSDGKTTTQVNAPNFPVRLAPGAGAKLTIKMKRFANDPTLSFPWESTVADLGKPGDIAKDAVRAAIHKTAGQNTGERMRWIFLAAILAVRSRSGCRNPRHQPGCDFQFRPDRRRRRL
jgi:hypothetical protein